MDVAQDILTLLSDNWNSSNTNSLTPAFYKVTDLKDYDFNENNYVILAQVPIPMQKPAGIGSVAKQKFSRVRYDLRALGKDNEDNFRLMIIEIERIIDNNMINSISGWQIISLDDQEQTELSDKTKGLWRIIIPVTLSNYNVSR